MILPAVLANNEKDLLKLLDYSRKHFKSVQLDIMDGEMVPSKSVDAGRLKDLDYGALDVEVHLMVRDPALWLKYFKGKNISSMLFHIEIAQYYPEAAIKRIISEIQKGSKEAGIAINPATPLTALKPYVQSIGRVLFLCVDPGFYGAEFKPEVLEKVRAFKKDNPRIVIGVDGGVKSGNFAQVVSSGADYVCIGSAIFNTPDPRESFDAFEKKFSELKRG